MPTRRSAKITPDLFSAAPTPRASESPIERSHEAPDVARSPPPASHRHARNGGPGLSVCATFGQGRLPTPMGWRSPLERRCKVSAVAVACVDLGQVSRAYGPPCWGRILAFSQAVSLESTIASKPFVFAALHFVLLLTLCRFEGHQCSFSCPLLTTATQRSTR